MVRRILINKRTTPIVYQSVIFRVQYFLIQITVFALLNEFSQKLLKSIGELTVF